MQHHLSVTSTWRTRYGGNDSDDATSLTAALSNSSPRPRFFARQGGSGTVVPLGYGRLKVSGSSIVETGTHPRQHTKMKKSVDVPPIAFGR
eukprot:COSAG02_NODE_352_length_24036_cov_20.479258_16_plen_91_part_00